MLTNRTFFLSLRWQIVITYLVIILIGFTFIGVSVLDIIGKYMIDNKKNAFRLYANWVAQAVAYDYASGDPDILASIVYDLQALGEEIFNKELEATRILILNKHGVVDYDSYNIVRGSDSLLKQDLSEVFPEINAVLAGERVEPKELYIRPEGSREPKLVLYTYAPIQHEKQGIIGMVIISTSLSRIEHMLAEVKTRVSAYLIIISAIIITASYIISGFITQPIKELTNVIKKMSQGYLDQRVKIRGSKELRQLAEAFNIMSEKLENLDKARNEFVSNASHELKTPLSAIKVLTESLLHMDVDDPSIYREFLEDINSEIDRLNAIINDLLTLVKIDTEGEQLKQEPVDLVELVDSTVKGLQILAHHKNIRLETFYDDHLTVYGDAVKLRQVVSNIVDNAIKYTPEGGRVTVEVYKGVENAVIKVSDTGIGIPAKDLPHIFERFYRVDKARSRATGGTGLGLSIAQKIVLQHGGNIRVVSEEGKGSTFYVELPLKSEKQ
ncbi:signal transduction histidine kinase [Caldicoprobacter guelmensis]|uniref:sensor histidine kinase n=1 Tax=Caldicoprobacter guelmensis TaxID=1170224 RepID=UPI00195A344A|nr:HAMP domain-containing sensor histidine kinase [Caldicoprobacter guelmensis]MBM7582665.1 signal transduction histidine kinase [Caldicoprobacter guelmensis]